MSTFGKRLRQAREKKGLTQVQLANMLGVKGNSISDWENDKNRPHMDTIELIMGVLEVDANTLLGWNDPIQRKTDAEILANEVMSNPKIKQALPVLSKMSDKDLEFVVDFINRLVKEK